MNYLAHLLLASHSEDAMVGAFLGDFVKGSDATAFAEPIAREIAVHRRVDAFTDAHHIVREARQCFDPSRRRFSGIALDVFYDHVLASQWQHYHDEPLHGFSTRCYRVLQSRAQELPERARLTASRMSRHDWLGAYAGFDGVEGALAGIGRRLSRNGELLAACADDLREHYEPLAEGFHVLFPELRRMSEQARRLSAT